MIGVTGSTGKTSTKDLLLAVLSPHRRTVASRANFNTEIGLPLRSSRRRRGTEVLVLEMGMRGAGQIAELAAIAEPDVGVIVSIGPVHLELLGSLEAIAAAKAELIAGAARRAAPRSSRPASRCSSRTCAPTSRRSRSAPAATSSARSRSDARPVEIDAGGRARSSSRSRSPQAHLRHDLLAAVAAALRARRRRPAGASSSTLSPRPRRAHRARPAA